MLVIADNRWSPFAHNREQKSLWTTEGHWHRFEWRHHDSARRRSRHCGRHDGASRQSHALPAVVGLGGPRWGGCRMLTSHRCWSWSIFCLQLTSSAIGYARGAWRRCWSARRRPSWLPLTVVCVALGRRRGGSECHKENFCTATLRTYHTRHRQASKSRGHKKVKSGISEVLARTPPLSYITASLELPRDVFCPLIFGPVGAGWAHHRKSTKTSTKDTLGEEEESCSPCAFVRSFILFRYWSNHQPQGTCNPPDE